MPTLPYTKTTVVDNSAYQSSLVADTGINIATIIKADTGPMERVSLSSADDLIGYFCTGTKITAKTDQTIQCIGAMLGTTGVDVIRVGTANIKVGKTNDGKIVYTDSNYNPIPKLSRLKFTSVENDPTTLCINIGDTTYYVGRIPDDSLTNAVKIEGDITIENLIRGVSDKCISIGEDYIITAENNVSCKYGEIDTISLETTYISTNKVLEPILNNEIPVNSYITIDNTSYFFVGDGKNYSQDDIDKLEEGGASVVKIKNSLNTISTERFIAKVISTAYNEGTETSVTSDVKFDFSHVIEMSQGENDEYGYTSTYDFSTRMSDLGIYTYSKDDELTSGYFTIDNFPDSSVESGFTKRRFAWNMTNTDFNKEDQLEVIHTYTINTQSTDFIEILQEFELQYARTFDTLIPVYTQNDEELVTPSIYFENSTVSIATFDKYTKLEEVSDSGVYKTYISLKEIEDTELSVMVDNIVYYIGEDPSDIYQGSMGSVRLGNIPMTISEFKKKLFNQLETDLIIGRIDDDTIWVQGEVNAISKSAIIVTKAIKNQTVDLADSKFALIAKFPSTKKLFHYEFIKDTSNEDFDVLKINYFYNQLSGSMIVSFDAEAVDGYGNVLYFDRYNDGQYENSLFKIIELNEDVDCPQNEQLEVIDYWGNEVLIGEPDVGNYQAALLKYEDYEDKQYRFIWDSGYSQPAFAKTMFTLACDKNAQAVPSYPVTYRKGNEEEVLTYYTAIGCDSPRMQHVIPAHKSTYNGAFLTTVPGSYSYIVARVNSYKNVTPEFQPLFGATRGAVSAPNLVWNINKTTQQKFADSNINCIVHNINGTYLNFNMTGQKKTTYLSQEQNMYMSNVIAGVCESYNPTLIAEMNTPDLWNQVETTVTSMLNQRMMAGKNPAPHSFRVRCVSVMEANPDYVESLMLKYYVDVCYDLAIGYVEGWVSVVRMNSF